MPRDEDQYVEDSNQEPETVDMAVPLSCADWSRLRTAASTAKFRSGRGSLTRFVRTPAPGRAGTSDCNHIRAGADASPDLDDDLDKERP